FADRYKSKEKARLVRGALFMYLEYFRCEFLHVEVQIELIRMRAQAQRVHVLALEVDVHFDQIIGENATGFEEFVVIFQSVEYFFERTRNGRDADAFFRLQFVQILVERIARLDFVLDSVQSGHELRGQRQINVAGHVGRAELDALGFRRFRVQRNAHGRRTVALRIQQVNWRFIAGNQTVER